MHSSVLPRVGQGCPIRVAWGEKLPDGTTDIEYSIPDFTSLVNDSDTGGTPSTSGVAVTKVPDMAIREGIVLDSIVRK